MSIGSIVSFYNEYWNVRWQVLERVLESWRGSLAAGAMVYELALCDSLAGRRRPARKLAREPREARRQMQEKIYTMMRLHQKETKESARTTMRPNGQETKQSPKRANLVFCTTDKTNSPPTDQSVDYSVLSPRTSEAPAIAHESRGDAKRLRHPHSQLL